MPYCAANPGIPPLAVRLPLNKHKNAWLLAMLAILIGCTPVLLYELDSRWGPADSTRYQQATAPASNAPEYWHDVRPILEQRCAVCHGCYDAPCQQNLTAWEGITRGANPDPVYSNRLRTAEPSRLFIDAQTPVEWRQKNFHPVLNERENSREANLQGSVLYRLLDLKRRQPLPDTPVLDDKAFTFSLNREQSCPRIEELDKFERDHPLWGMPYGLPALNDEEFRTLEDWLAAGAPVAASPAMPAAIARDVAHWETFLNGDSLKARLMSRYLYEHLFLAHLYFDKQPASNTRQRYFFRLVRSSTPPGEPVAEIPTRRPFDDPGSAPFWYRLRLETGSIVEKTHMPYALNAVREKKWRQWFLDADYAVTALPSYAPEVASNPFVAFEALPVDSRYRFLLDEAQFAIDNFIKGPVCRGQVALGVIDEHFWVFFVAPEKLPIEETASFLARESQHLRLPAEQENSARVLDWLKYSNLQKNYLKAKATALEQNFNGKARVTLDLIWDGDGNDNAALTVFRHTDSASVVKGLVGQPPKTAWVMSYALLERIHYLLVAGYDVYGNLAHQLNTRLYMDFMRMEGEANFLMLLPAPARPAIRDFWYREASADVKNYLYGEHYNLDIQSSIRYRSADPQQELYAMLAKRLQPVLPGTFSLQRESRPAVREALQQLQAVRGAELAVFPQHSILRVTDSNGSGRYFSLLNNSGFANNSELFGEDKRRRPAEDYLTVVPGIIGAYPNAFFDVPAARLGQFAAAIKATQTEADYRALADRYAVRRTNPAFWAFSDALQRDYLRWEPVKGGILDYNRLENR